MKAIARAEPVATKTHGNVQTVPAVFLFITSNRKLLTHCFDKPERNSKLLFNRVYKSDLKVTRNIHQADIDAVQNRFIEAFVRSRPQLPEDCLPNNENFSRLHVIVGLYNIVVEILLKWTVQDFKAPYMYLYPIGGLCKNLTLLPIESQANMKEILFGLMLKYKLDDNQIKQCCKNMKYSPVKEENICN
jgi:hypothetical protein